MATSKYKSQKESKLNIVCVCLAVEKLGKMFLWNLNISYFMDIQRQQRFKQTHKLIHSHMYTTTEKDRILS